MEKKQNKNDWKGLVQGFVGDIMERISDNVSKKIHVFLEQLKRRTAGVILILIGFIFFLVGFTLFINALFDNAFPWIGWSVSGFFLLLIGYIMSKK